MALPAVGCSPTPHLTELGTANLSPGSGAGPGRRGIDEPVSDRKKIPPETQARILAESRRRCAVCFGLNGDLSRKRGQLAHLGKDASKTSVSDLIFLCFDHHDEFDSTTRQSKNLTREEIEHYRDELIAELERRWSAEVLDRPDVDGPPFSINMPITGGPGGPGGIFGSGGGGGAGIGGGGQGGGAGIRNGGQGGRDL